jgi:tetratricopeptide (TPR) repeat protein/O-antigen ligase
MRTKLSVFCDKVLETGWLLAVIIAPLFFNVYSSRVFEPDKLSIVRSIALMMIVGWLVKVIDGSAWSASSTAGPNGEAAPPQPSLWQRLSAVPLVVPTILLVGSYLLSTVLSVAPEISLWGSYMRLQGTYTTYSYIVIFFLMLGSLRQREQLDRLCSTIILTSLPISLYGILQHFGLDSLPWSGEVTQRVASNMGNSIFVAAYLIMTVPLTLARLLDSFSTLLKEQEGTISHALLAGCYTFVMTVQLICIFFTQSRGPWLGLLGGLYVFMLVALISLRRSIGDQSPVNTRDVGRAVAFAVGSIPLGILPAYVGAVALKRGWRWLWLSWVIHTLLIVAFLIVLNLPNTPLSSLRSMPYVGRLGSVFELEAGTGKVRVLIWEGAVQLITANPLRTLIGYGPETMHVAYNPYYPPELAHIEARNASPDRSHNETFDALVIGGIVGFVAYMLVFSSIFYYGLKWLGFIETKRQRNLFLALAVAGGALGVVLPKVLEGSFKLAGVGFPAGFIAGISIYLMVSAAFFYTKEQPAMDAPRQLLLIGLLSAVVAHFIEIHFGIAIASTRVHFWVYAALFVLLGLNRIGVEAPAPTLSQPQTASMHAERADRQQERQSKRSRRRVRRQVARQTAVLPRSVLHPAFLAGQEAGLRQPSLTTKVIIASLIVSVILFTMGFEFIANPMGEADSLRIIQLSLTTLIARSDSRTSYGTLWMFCLTWLVGALVVLAETERSASSRQPLNWWLSALGVYTAVTLTVLIFGVALHTAHIKPGVDIGNTIVFYYQALALLGLLLALALTVDISLPPRLLRMANSWVYAILVVLAVLGIYATNVSVVKADIYYKQGLKLEEEGRYDVALQLYDRAIKLAPDQDYYYLFLGRALMGKASTVTTNDERVSWFNKSFEALDKARRLNPLNTDHYANLGRLYRNWADVAATPEERAQKLEQAHNYYVQATTLSPHNAQLFNEWAAVYLARGDNAGGLEKINQSLALDPRYAATHLLLGNYYATQGNLDEAAASYLKATELDPENAEAYSTLGYLYFQQGNITDALTYNEQAVKLDPSLARAHSTLGLIYYRLGRLDDAVAENLTVLQTFPNDFISHRNLALLYQQLGNIDQALAHAQAALPLASGDDKPALQSFVEQLQAQKAATQTQQ